MKKYETYDQIKNNLKDCGSYWLDLRFNPEKEVFPSCKVSAGSFGIFLDHPKEPYLPSLNDFALERAGIKKKVFTDKSVLAMSRGRNEEPEIIKWFEQTYHVHIKPVGFVRPKFDFNLGGVPDGEIVETGDLIECKSFEFMPKDLKEFQELKVKPDTLDHIKVSHRAQSVGYLAMTGKQDKTCYYIGSCKKDKNVFVQPIRYDDKYWKELHTKIKIFVEKELDPLLNQHDDPPLLIEEYQD